VAGLSLAEPFIKVEVKRVQRKIVAANTSDGGWKTIRGHIGLGSIATSRVVRVT